MIRWIHGFVLDERKKNAALIVVVVVVVAGAGAGVAETTCPLVDNGKIKTLKSA